MTDADVFRRKARENFSAAQALGGRHPNSAANRAYYALYHAVVAELEAKGIQPQEIDGNTARAGPDDPMKWKHAFVRNNARLTGLQPRECAALKVALRLRVIADYKAEDVTVPQMQQLLREIPGILEALGAN